MEKRKNNRNSGGNGSPVVTLAEIAAKVNGRLIGDGRTKIRGAAGIREAAEGDITFLANRRYASLAAQTRASAIIVAEGVQLSTTLPTVVVKNPDIAFASAVETFAPKKIALPPGIHPTAVVAADAALGKDVAVGAHAVIESGARIGDGTAIHPLAFIGHNVTIGERCVIYPRVVVRERVVIGNNVVIHSGAVIGSDGFGYAFVNGAHQRIPQTGTVVLEDDVEVGANTTIDRARFDKTILRKGVKVDNLVQIGHNVIVDEHTIIAALNGIAGSSRIGKYVMSGGQAGFAGHVEIGDRCMIAARSGVTKSIPAGSAVSGTPAVPHAKSLREQGAIRKLPEMRAELRRLTQQISVLQERIQALEKDAKDHRQPR